jgi:hypothetical protein
MVPLVRRLSLGMAKVTPGIAIAAIADVASKLRRVIRDSDISGPFPNEPGASSCDCSSL